jgi:hypothetical protein
MIFKRVVQLEGLRFTLISSRPVKKTQFGNRDSKERLMIILMTLSMVSKKVPYLDQRYRHLIKPHFDFQIW